MSRFFIDRPVFAWVIALVIMLGGLMAMLTLPVAMYPTIAPPKIDIRASYPGASAQVVTDSVTQIIEQNMTGLDNLLYFSSSSDSTGRATVSLTFQTGTNPDVAQVQVQNKLQLAMPLLPQDVQRQGVTVNKASSSFLQVLAFYSDDGSLSRQDIADFVGSTLQDPLSRVAGVGNLQVFGSKYAMRIWLDPNKLHTYALSTSEVVAAIQAQNAQVALGQLGGTPAIQGQQINATVNAQDRLNTPDEFRAIVVRSNADGSVLRLGDVASVELGSESYDFLSRFNGKPASGVAISLATGANALETAANVKKTLDALKPSFPASLQTTVAFDTTPFVRVAIGNVVETLIEAVILVFLVMYLFLQNFRATLIPTIAVPVVLLGTFGTLATLGFSINMLTMFALVLAIGLLVDDAIVVVENVERLMSERGLSPKEAARESMDQITGALVAIGLVLSAVFIPMAFMTGSTGVIYRQFSATIVSAMALSVVVALVLTPALCATMLKPLKKGEHHEHKGFFRWFNKAFGRTSSGYQSGVRGVIARSGRFMLIYAVLAAVMVLLYLRLPSAFVPGEDQGMLLTQVQTPIGSTQERTMQTVYRVEDHFLQQEKDAVQSIMTVQGFSFAGLGQNNAMAFVRLKDWGERSGAELRSDSVAHRAMGALQQIKDAMVFVFELPAMPELGVATGFDFFLKDGTGRGHDALLAARNQVLGAAAQSPLLTAVRPNGQEDAPQLRVHVDTGRAMAAGLTLDAINSTLATAWGGSYIDDFVDRGRVKRVYIQGDSAYRMTPEDFAKWSVKNNAGKMVPFASFATAKWEYGPQRLERYNGVPAMEIQGQAARGVSSGVAMAEIERIVSTLPEGFTIEWTALSFQERQAGEQTTLLYALSLLVVFLCLAALYESWSIPTAVLMVAPLGILGAALGNTMRGLERDVYFQVAMLTTVGLTSKNAILIVEFAKQYLDSGKGLLESTMQAVADRFRPIVMTSLAFGLGVLPLAIASGAGSGAQRAIGTGVLGGMLMGTIIGVFFIPLFFVVVERVFGRLRRKPVAETAVPPSALPSGSTGHE